MSRHGESGPPYGAYPGQPDQPGEPYDPPSDPWGQTDGDLTVPLAPGAQPGYGQPSYPEAGDPEPGWDPDPGREWDGRPGSATPAPERRGNVLLFVAVGILVVVVAGAVGYALYLLSGDDSTPIATETSSPPTEQTPPATEPEPESTQNRIGLAATQAREGDCLVNYGDDAEPQMQIVGCESDEDRPVYQVLAKLDRAVEGADRAAQDLSAQETCGDTDGYTHHYFEVSPTLSFVLCMREEEA